MRECVSMCVDKVAYLNTNYCVNECPYNYYYYDAVANTTVCVYDCPKSYKYKLFNETTHST